MGHWTDYEDVRYASKGKTYFVLCVRNADQHTASRFLAFKTCLNIKLPRFRTVTNEFL